jgi:hypothetical protein
MLARRRARFPPIKKLPGRVFISELLPAPAEPISMLDLIKQGNSKSYGQ